MRQLLVLLMAVLFVNSALAEEGGVADSVREVVLDNGMRLLLVQRPGAPMISAGWVAHVGSADERPGITGISHLFEHMMFKGSDRIGTKDAALDKQLRDQLDQVREKMFALERDYRLKVRLGKAESVSDADLQTDEMKALREQFADLIQQQRDNMIKDEFDQIYTEAGATGQNAFTNRDMTVYFIRVPRNKLELWFWMESERLRQPVFREFYSERDVVYEERRMRTDSTPTGVQDEVFDSLFWRGHPYGWPVVGWPSDISSITREQAEAYFDQFYAPNNITAAIVGDFDETEALRLAQRYLGSIPGSGKRAPAMVTLAMPQLGDLIYRAEVDAPPSVTVAWRTTAFEGENDPALQVLAQTLSGKTGRLYKRLVLQEQIATSAGATADSQKYDGEFMVYANGKNEISPDRLRAVLLEEIAEIQRGGISDYELQKVKNQLAADKYRRLEDNFFLLIQLLYYDGLRDWRTMDSSFERINLVSREDVQRVAKTYLTAQNRASKMYTRKASSTPQDPALAKLTAEQQQMARQMLSQLGQVDAEQLPEAFAQLESFLGQAPEQAKPAIQYVIDQLKQKQSQ